MDYGQHLTVEDLRRTLIREKKDKNNLRAETLREQLDPQAMLIQLFEILVETKTAAKEDVPALTLRSNILLSLLKKCMPDLKQVEIKNAHNKRSTLTIDFNGVGKKDQN